MTTSPVTSLPVERHEGSRPPRVAELFAGVGGFRRALDPLGFDTVWANQWEPSTRSQHAFECYVSHFRASRTHVCEDIAAVLDRVDAGQYDIPDHDVLVGGFPCQDYSVARTLNQALGLEGKKGILWWQIYRLLIKKRPPYVFLENVDRLLKSPATCRGRDFAIMLAALGSLGYEVEWRMVNAADYGFPQRRRRVYIVARHSSLGFRSARTIFTEGILARSLPASPGPDEMPPLTVGIDPAYVSDSFACGRSSSPFRSAGFYTAGDVWTYDATAEWSGYRRTLGDVLEDEDDVPTHFFIPESQIGAWAYLKGPKNVPRTHRGSGAQYFYSEGGIAFPDRLDMPSRTILTGEGGSTPSRFKHVVRTPSGRLRRLTPRELERLNGFPDDWTKTGMSDGRRAFMMGNALVVGIVAMIGQSLLADFVAWTSRGAASLAAEATVAAG